MATYRHCSGCGRGFNQGIWQRETFCGSCGWPLKQLPREEPLEIHPYPDRAPGPVGRRQELGNAISEVRMFAGQHPYVFGAGVVAGGTGVILLAPAIWAFGHGLMVAGGILSVLGILGAFAGSGKDAANTLAGGVLILATGAGIMLLANLLMAAGVMAVLTGSAVAAKAAVEYGMRKRIEHQLREKNLTELISLSRQLEN